MNNFVLSCDPAKRSGSGISVSFHLDGRADAFPHEEYEIKTSKEAQRLFDDYVSRAEASKLGLSVSGRLRGNARAPIGFRKLDLRKFVNIEPAKSS